MVVIDSGKFLVWGACAMVLGACDGGRGSASEGGDGIDVTDSRGSSTGGSSTSATTRSASTRSSDSDASTSASDSTTTSSDGDVSSLTSLTSQGDGSDSSETGDPPQGCGDGGTSVVDFSYIWIANSTQGTVSKIDTQSAREDGRYYVGDYEGASISSCQGPSRTSVNLDGDVAVLDRGGGLTKVIANPDECEDTDASGTIETSSDENPLPWTEDECVAWKVDVPHSGSGCDGPRTVQWTAPEAVSECEFAAPRVWVAFCNADDDDATVWLLDGDDGSQVQQTAIPGYGCNTYGPYGGAVDAQNNLYFVDRSSGQSLYRIDYDCTQVEDTDCWTEFEQPAGEDAYGITIDAMGRVWMAGSGNSLYAFDTTTETYFSLQSDLDAFFASGPADSNSNNTLRGLMADEEGVLWIASIANGAWGGGNNPGLLRVDPSVDPVEIDWFGPSILTGIQHAAGTSIDVDGNVWLVDTRGDQAFKIDPVAPEMHDVVGGLQYPYTYSDMTGFALKQILPQ